MSKTPVDTIVPTASVDKPEQQNSREIANDHIEKAISLIEIAVNRVKLEYESRNIQITPLQDDKGEEIYCNSSTTQASLRDPIESALVHMETAIKIVESKHITPDLGARPREWPNPLNLRETEYEIPEPKEPKPRKISQEPGRWAFRPKPYIQSVIESQKIADIDNPKWANVIKELNQIAIQLKNTTNPETQKTHREADTKIQKVPTLSAKADTEIQKVPTLLAKADTKIQKIDTDAKIQKIPMQTAKMDTKIQTVRIRAGRIGIENTKIT